MLDKKAIEEFKVIYKEKYNKDLTQAEASESANNLIGFFELLYNCAEKEHFRKLRLKKEPKGFHLTDGTYTCMICRRNITGDETWYDRWGIKCPDCQNATDKKIIPGKVCRDEDCWYGMYDFESLFKLKSPTVRKLVRQKILKARIIPNNNFYVFLIKDNEDILPPKELLESRTIKVGENTYSSQDWYEFKDPKETLGGYKIWPHLAAFNSKS